MAFGLNRFRHRFPATLPVRRCAWCCLGLHLGPTRSCTSGSVERRRDARRSLPIEPRPSRVAGLARENEFVHAKGTPHVLDQFSPNRHHHRYPGNRLLRGTRAAHAGLHQMAIQVLASLPDEDWPVVATIGGVSSLSAIVLTVKKRRNSIRPSLQRPPPLAPTCSRSSRF